MCVYCAVTSMSAQVPTLTDTTVQQTTDIEAITSTADTTCRIIEGGICLFTYEFTYVKWIRNQLVWYSVAIYTCSKDSHSCAHGACAMCTPYDAPA